MGMFEKSCKSCMDFEGILPRARSTVLKVFFRLLYHGFSWSYDLVANIVSAGHWQQWIEQALPFVVGPRVLEIGFGPGHMQLEMTRRGVDCIGIDQSINMCNKTKGLVRSRFTSRNKYNGYAKSAKIVCGTGEILPFRSHSFNSVIATFPTEYILSSQTAYDIHRVLLPGGRLVIILTASLTGKAVSERFGALLFRLTGQSEDWTPILASPYEEAGLAIHDRWIDLGHSRVLVLIGNKTL